MSQIHSHSDASANHYQAGERVGDHNGESDVASVPSGAGFITAELGLGTRLNQAIGEGKRADFSYLLALLSDNVIEHSSVALKRSSTPSTPWQPPFPYGPSVPLQCTEAEYQRTPVRAFGQSRALWQLQHALQPAGLNPVNDPKHIPAEVVANCPHYVQQRLSPGKGDDPRGEEADLIDVIDRLRGVERAVA